MGGLDIRRLAGFCEDKSGEWECGVIINNKQFRDVMWEARDNEAACRSSLSDG
jgi:hypothetical protein